MGPRRPKDPREIERIAIRALAQALARLFRGRKSALLIVCALALGFAAPSASAEVGPDDALRTQLERLNPATLSPEQRRELAQAARRTRDPKLAAMAVDALRKVGDRESLPLLDAIAGGKLRVPAVDADALSVRARLAAADVRMRVAERMIHERMRAG